MIASAHKFSQKILGEGGLRLLSTLFVLFLARRLGAEEFGRYSTAMAYAALCIVFVDLGTNALLTREIARHPEDRIKIGRSSHGLKIAASLGAWLILFGVTCVLGFSREQRYITLCLGVVVIGQTLMEYFSALLNGIEEMGWEAVLKIVGRLLSLTPGFIAIARHQTLTVIASQLALGSLAGYAAAAWIVRERFTSFGIRWDPVYMKNLLHASFPLFGSVIFWILYDSQDVLLLNYFHFAQHEIGWFSAAMKIMDVTRVYPVLMMGVFFPTLSKLHLSDPSAFQRKQRKIMIFMGASLIALAGAVYAGAPWIITLLYKSDFLPAAFYLRLLAPTLLVMGINHAQNQLLISLNRERKLLTGALLVCTINLLAAFLLLPHYGVAGVCYALLGSELTYFVFLRYTLTRES